MKEEEKELLFYILFICKNFKEPSKIRDSLFEGKHSIRSILELLLKNYFTNIRNINIKSDEIDPMMMYILNLVFE